MSPAILVRRIGLADRAGSQIARRLLIEMDPTNFAHVTRLAPAEARALTLLDWRDRYQPIDSAVSLWQPGKWSQSGTYNWLYADSLRHCPACLAGDGSDIQNRYGGAWRRIWRLPVAFACVRHQIFLSEGCGADHARRLGAIRLIPSSAVSGLHPAQCRLPRPGEHGHGSLACGNPLDQPPGATAIRLTQSHLDAQEQVLRHLGPGTTPREAVQFFADLRLIAAFLAVLPPSSWSAIDSAVRDVVADTIDRYTAPPYSTCERAPADVLSTATMITGATAVLADSDRQAELFRLTYSTAHPFQLRALAKIWAQLAAQSSHVVQRALIAALNASSEAYSNPMGAPVVTRLRRLLRASGRPVQP